jgi:hypothetical protein
MVAPHLAVTPGNTVTPYVMGKIFDMPLKPIVLSYLQSLAILVDTLSATSFIHIVMHDELATGAFE